MISVTVTNEVKRELEKLLSDEMHIARRSYLHEFWERLADYTEIDPKWLYDRGIRYEHDERHGGMIPPPAINGGRPRVLYEK